MGIKELLIKTLSGELNAMYSTADVLGMLLKSLVLGLCIYAVYRIQTRSSFFSASLAVSLVGVAVVTCGIIITIQYSLVVSLGMVGALSIVRFRTAIKDPVDLLYLYWSISVGIICGAGITRLAIYLSVIVAAVIIILGNIPTVRAPMLLVVHCSDTAAEKALLPIVGKYGNSLVEELSGVEGVASVSLLSHDGEAVN
ncbi:MAG: DUF4956 domain-containing protein [Eubacteriales bacterium]|nr:DUF4956 domain-containing protein [Eubacteriales bacterium]